MTERHVHLICYSPEWKQTLSRSLSSLTMQTHSEHNCDIPGQDMKKVRAERDRGGGGGGGERE